MANRGFVAVAAAIGFASAVVGLVQAFSFSHLRRIECQYIPEATVGHSRALLPCLREIQQSVDEVVLIDWVTYVGESRTNAYGERVAIPFERRATDEAVSFHFDYLTLSTEVGAVVEDTGNADQAFREIDRAFAGDGVSVQNLDFLSDGGFVLTIYTGGGAGTSPLTIVELNRFDGWSGMVDQATGPMQVTLLAGDSRHYRLSPAPVTDDLAKQVRCAQREWPEILKFIACPFL